MSRMLFYMPANGYCISRLSSLEHGFGIINSLSAVLVYGLKYSGLGYGSILEYTLTRYILPRGLGKQIQLSYLYLSDL